MTKPEVELNESEHTIPPRLHVLLASQSPQALVIRRGPSRQTAIIGWDRSTDRFQPGQWLKGNIYAFRSDISPDGKHWIYFALKPSQEGWAWTVLARVPYLKALDFYPKNDCWNGGGLFISNDEYWLNDGGPYQHERKLTTSRLKVAENYQGEPNWQGECPLIYFRRLARDGWTTEPEESLDCRFSRYPLSKRVNNHWTLVKYFNVKLDNQPGKGIYHETHSLRSASGLPALELPHWEWADLDGGRLVWAEQGLIRAGFVSKKGLEKEQTLFDTGPMVFEPLKAPY